MPLSTLASVTRFFCASTPEAERLLLNTTHEFFSSKPPIPKYSLLGRVYFYTGGKVKARDAYQSARVYIERALAEQPQSAFVQLTLAELMAGIGERGEAMRLCERAMEMLPVSRDAWTGRGVARGLRHDLRHARERRSCHTIDRTLARHSRFSASVEGPSRFEVGIDSL